MLLTTTPTVQGQEITKYLGVVCGEVVVGAHIGKDILASFTNIVGGRSNAYESTLRETRDGAIAEMMQEAGKLGADGIVGVKFDYTVIGQGGSMMMVAVSGTAVTLG
ncbi:MAG: YbjQ family protein [Hyphomonas sp.]|uniref:YbjQ family protein n=1 Tax=Hyphomonas sp. TaxID=87 RepID=UPI003527B57B